MMPLYKAKKTIKKFKVKNEQDFRNFKKLKNFPQNFPRIPDQYYKNKGWKGWKDFLGTE